ncbi:MAG: DUF5715 family protein [Flavobacteriales bacterium]|nr:DUF5715 family protein [Flavobacteriales bacterium]
MSKDWMMRLRWDRIGVVVLVLCGMSSGLRAWVIADEASDIDGQFNGSEGLSLLSGAALDAADVRFAPTLTSTARLTDKGAAVLSDKADEPETEVLHVVAPVVEEPSGPLPRKNVKPCTCSKSTMKKLAHNPYTQHRKRARNLPGSFFVKNNADVQSRVQRGKIVEVTNSRGYHLGSLNHSKPYLLKDAKFVLDEIGRRFADAMEGTAEEGASIRVTSLTRTEWQHNKLKRRNRNATRGQSTHCFGASFDIFAVDRLNNTMKCGGPTWALQEILYDMQKKGEILVVPEGNCMHITPN